MDVNFARRVLVTTILFLVAFRLASAQQPAASPPQTGRSYEISNLPKTPPTPGPQGKSPVLFADITAASKVNFKHVGSPTSKKFLLETMGGGVAVLISTTTVEWIFFTNGALLREEMPPDAVPKRVKRSIGIGLSTASRWYVSRRPNVPRKGSGYSMGVAVGDFNNDVLKILRHWHGEITFIRITVMAFYRCHTKLAVGGGGWPTSAGWLDLRSRRTP